MSVLGPMPTYVVQASPLSKLFMSEWQPQVEADPELVFKEVAFTVRVPRPFGAVVLEHNKPVHVTKVKPARVGMKPNAENRVDDDLEGFIFWLTGGPDGMRSEETDIYGVVGLQVDFDVSGALSDIAMFAEEDKDSQAKALKSYEQIQKDLVKNTKTALTQAKELADMRVRRAVKNTHHNLMKQYEIMKSDGKGMYSPSICEAVGAIILAQEIDQAGENRKKMLERLTAVMNENTIVR